MSAGSPTARSSPSCCSMPDASCRRARRAEPHWHRSEMTTPSDEHATVDRDITIRVAKATAVAIAVAALAAGVWQVRSVLILLILALTLAASIRPGVEWLGRHRVPQSLAILLHFLVVGGAVALLLWLAVPPALSQIGHAVNGPRSEHAAGLQKQVLTWVQHHLDQLPSGN